MSSVRNPVGPQPPSVYWRRRLVVLLGLIAVIVVIVLIVVRPGAEEAGRETPAPTTGPSNTPVATDGGQACDPEVIVVDPIIDASGDPGQYAAGVLPQISMSVRNTGSTPCTLDVGPGAQEYIIMSGSDLIWNSRDCLSGAAFEQVLVPGEPLVSNPPLVWDRTRSSADTCDSSRPQVIAGGATYRLSVKLGSIASESDKPFLLY